MKSIYERTNTSVKEVLRGMIIKPAHIHIKSTNKIKKYNLKKHREVRMEELKNFYLYNPEYVKNMSYNRHTDILTIETL